MVPIPVRPEVKEFKAYVPGLSIDEIKEKYALSTVIKMASNENPLGVSPVVQQRIEHNSSLSFRYAQAGTPVLCQALAAYLQVPPATLVAGNGSDEIIDLLLRVVARPGVDNVVAFKPSFSMYELQSRLCGVEFRQAPLNEDFSLPLDGLLSLVNEQTALVFVTNPDNPSGYACAAQELVDLAHKLPARTLLVVDEAYIEFTHPVERYSMLPHFHSLPNLVLLRTFSKIYGLAGLRLGYGIMPQWLADLLLRVKLPFSVNVLAEQAGLAALEDEVFLAETLRVVGEGRELLTQELLGLGCQVYPSQTNFIMFKPPIQASLLFESLLCQGIIIRPLASYGLPDMLRVTIGNMAENKEFIYKTKEILREHHHSHS